MCMKVKNLPEGKKSYAMSFELLNEEKHWKKRDYRGNGFSDQSFPERIQR